MTNNFTDNVGSWRVLKQFDSNYRLFWIKSIANVKRWIKIIYDEHN